MGSSIGPSYLLLSGALLAAASLENHSISESSSSLLKYISGTPLHIKEKVKERFGSSMVRMSAPRITYSWPCESVSADLHGAKGKDKQSFVYPAYFFSHTCMLTLYIQGQENAGRHRNDWHMHDMHTHTGQTRAPYKIH